MYPVAEPLGHFYKSVCEVELFVAGEAVFEQAGDDRTDSFADGAEEHEQAAVVFIKNGCLSPRAVVVGWPVPATGTMKGPRGIAGTAIAPARCGGRGVADPSGAQWVAGAP